MRTFWKAIVGLVNDNGMSLASSVAFSFLLSLFPLIIFSSSLVAFLGNEALIRDIIEGFSIFFPSEITAVLVPELEKVLKNQRVDLLTVGGFFMLFFASTGTQSLRGALNQAYRVEEDRSIIWLLFHSFIFVIQFTFVMIVIGTAVFSATFVAKQIAPAVNGWTTTAMLIQIISYTIAFTVMTLELIIIHAWLPAERRTFSQIWPGAVLSVIFMLGCVVGYSYYVGIANYDELYAGLSQFVIVLIFFQIMAMIIILGAGYNRARMVLRGE